MSSLLENMVIDKSSKTPLTTQLCDILKENIIKGRLKPGKRIPGIRQLTRQYNVSVNTVIESLNLMEEQNYVEKIPTKGTFVADDVKHEFSRIKIALAFPEEDISLASVHNIANYFIASSVHHGAICEAKLHNAEIDFIHFNEPENEIQLSRQMRRVKAFDGIFFIGHQLEQLRNECLKENIPCVMVGSFYGKYKTDCMLVEDDVAGGMDEMCKHLAERNFKRVASVIHIPHKDESGIRKIAIFNEKAEKYGLQANNKDTFIVTEANSEQVNQAMKKIISFKEKTALFIAHTYLVPLVYKFCRLNNYPLGDKIGVFGYATGANFTFLDPAITHIKAANVTRGELACKLLVNTIRNHSRRQEKQLVKGELVIGETT